MTTAVAEEDALWAAVADPTRRRVLDALLEHGEATTTTLAQGLPVTRQAVAKHLVVLDRVGLVVGGLVMGVDLGRLCVCVAHPVLDRAQRHAGGCHG